MTQGWICPTMQKVDGVIGARIVDPAELAGRLAIRVDAEMCLEPWGRDVCGLVRNHRGDHWCCSRSLVELSGPFAIVRGDE